MEDIKRIISELEAQKAAIERAIAALRDIAAPASTPKKKSVRSVSTASSTKQKPRLSPEGRQRIIDATRKRWAAKRAAAGGTAAKKSTAKR